LKDFKSLPYPKGYILEQLGNRLIYDERNYDTSTLKVEFQQLFSQLTGKFMCTICIIFYVDFRLLL
jgi:hypothetical protein